MEDTIELPILEGRWLDMAEREPWAVLYAALAAEKKNIPRSEEMTEAVTLAAMLVVGSVLVERGATVASVARQFHEAGWQLRLSYDGDTGEVGLIIDWDDDALNGVVA